MANNLEQQFEAFELFSEEKLMRGFLRIGRIELIGLDKYFSSCEELLPFDMDMGKNTVKTASHLLGVLGEVLFSVAHCREISVLLAGIEEEGGGVDGRELVCQLSAEASSKMTMLMGDVLTYETRLYEFPSPDLAKKYFLWRQRENEAFTLNKYFEHALRRGGTDPERIPEMVKDFEISEKIEILKQQDIEFQKIAAWQRRGVALYWQGGVGDEEPSLKIDMELPVERDYEEYLSQFL